MRSSPPPHRYDEFGKRGNELGDCVYQQCEIDNGHGLSPHFVRLNWRDVNKESQRGRHSAKGRRTPETGATLHKRRTEARSLLRYETAGKFVHDHTRGGREESLPLSKVYALPKANWLLPASDGGQGLATFFPFCLLNYGKIRLFDALSVEYSTF